MDSASSSGMHSVRLPLQSILAVLPLLFILFAETVVAFTVYPFIAKLIGSLDVVHGDKENVGYYLGILEFIPNAISVIVVLQWARFGDRYGRKPVLLMNIGGLAIAIVCLGLSRTFTALALSKVIEGLFKASRPTVKAAVAESSDESRMAFVFSLLPIMHTGGAVIGPLIGGTLADPAKRFPSLFRSSFWMQFPYLLPTIISGMICLCSLCVAAMFHKETLPSVGDPNRPLTAMTDDADDVAPLLGHPNEESQDRATEAPHPGFFSKKQLRVFHAVLGNYAIFILLAMSFNATFALFLASPTTSGGLSLPPPTVGNIMSLSAGLNTIMQACFFTRAHRRWGPGKIYRCAAVAFIPTYAAMPIMGMIAKRAGHATPIVWAVLVLQQIACVLTAPGFTCMFIFIAKATPSPNMLGRTNGLAQMVHSAMSAIGPAAFTSLTALSIRHNLFGGTMAQLIQASLGFLAVVLSFSLPDVRMPS